MFADIKYKDLTPAIAQAELDRVEEEHREYTKQLKSTIRLLKARDARLARNKESADAETNSG